MDRITSFDDVSSWLDAHELLWQLDEFRSLGRFHACIDAADVKIEAAIYSELPSGLENFTRVELTSFGHEVGADVPRWWVFAREPSVGDLRNNTKLIFTSAQTLVRSAERLGREQAPTYEHIIREVADFLRRHSREIEALLTFANNLSMKHELAPAILFSYAVWGSTKRGDRSLEGCSEEDESERCRLAGELALGIRSRLGLPTLVMGLADLHYEAYGALPETDYISIPESTLLHRAQIHIREYTLTYFTGLRDSVRHIDTLCQEYLRRENLYADDRFAKRLLKKISGQRSEVENHLWDIKETLEMWSAPSAHKEAAAIKFCERVAAFANRKGGVLLIGVTDKTHEIVGVADPENRVKQIETTLRKYTDAQEDFAHIRAVPFDVAGSPRPPCIIIVVGQTEAPVGVCQVNSSYTYPLRIGPGIKRVSRQEVSAAKAHMKGTDFSFVFELEAWVSDVT